MSICLKVGTEYGSFVNMVVKVAEQYSDESKEAVVPSTMRDACCSYPYKSCMTSS